ncbi:MAG: hypothetical protein U9Q67_02110 [Patescibacteria group bacterium]|nr:hypothetical protein [Patescibacteria group bacterium]
MKKHAVEPVNVHILHHTHWDREWFLSFQYTREWVPKLIDQIEKLVSTDPDYKYLLDGQTLIIEDLLDIKPGYKSKIKKLLKNGNVLIGPYYCQPDWKIVGGESLVRNLMHGYKDTKQYTEFYPVAWLVDTFGHPAQSPQIHRMFGIKHAYVWRGVPKLIPFFKWHGSDKSELFTINLFTGYRNLYGVTKVPEVGLARLKSEVKKISKFYPIDFIPLFDGYDLEDAPENAVKFYKNYSKEIKNSSLSLKMSHPLKYAQVTADNMEKPDVIKGELNSGKYAGIYPGITSSRTYLKILNADTENLIFNILEPIATFAAVKGQSYPSKLIDSITREMMQNQIHDCICGVSLDLVHERMEYSYKSIYRKAKKQVCSSLNHIMQDFKKGLYTFSATGFSYDYLYPYEGDVYEISTKGVGVFPIKIKGKYYNREDIVQNLTWKNDYYESKVQSDGTVLTDQQTLGFFEFEQDLGDAYTNETTSKPVRIEMKSVPRVVEESKTHKVVRFRSSLQVKEVKVELTVNITFDQTPLIKWKIDMDSLGTDFNIKMKFKNIKHKKVLAGMQYDIVERDYEDKDLMPKEIDDEIMKIVIGQREINSVENFPFHDFVILEDDEVVNVILANGLRDYVCREEGQVEIMLRRSAEWMDRKNLRKMTNRLGDAGSELYGVGGRCERKVVHELAFMQTPNNEGKCSEIYKWNHVFKNPPLIIKNNNDGSMRKLKLFNWELPITALYMNDDKVLVRTFNPTDSKIRFSKKYKSVDPFGKHVGDRSDICPKEIMTIKLDHVLGEIDGASKKSLIQVSNLPKVRVGRSNSLPSKSAVDYLRKEIKKYKRQIRGLRKELRTVKGKELHKLESEVYTLSRSMYELILSKYVAERQIKTGNKLTKKHVYEYDRKIAKIGKKLNDLRIIKRIYDYVTLL